MTVEIISLSISTKVWDRTWIELATPGSAVRHASVARHVTDCATRPGFFVVVFFFDWEWGRNSAPRDGQKRPCLPQSFLLLPHLKPQKKLA